MDDTRYGINFIQTGQAFKVGTDSVLLADFANISNARRVIDLGCGGGTLMILLALRNPAAAFTGVEISPEAAEEARENVRQNDLTGRVEVITGDLRELDSGHAGLYDHVVSNPPYFPLGKGKPAPDPLRASARDERFCTLAELCRAARYLCRWGGLFSLVHRPERLSEVFVEMSRCGLEPKRLRFVQYDENSAPNLVLIEGRRGGKPGLSVEPPLIIRL